MRRLSLWSVAFFISCSVLVSGQGAPAQAPAPPPASADFVAPGPVQPLPPAVNAAVSMSQASPYAPSRRTGRRSLDLAFSQNSTSRAKGRSPSRSAST